MLAGGIILLIISIPLTIFLSLLTISYIGLNIFLSEIGFLLFLYIISISMLIGGILLIKNHKKKKKNQKIKENKQKEEIEKLKMQAFELKILKENQLINTIPKYCTYCGGKLENNKCTSCGALTHKEN